jgi:hypothetical protein
MIRRLFWMVAGALLGVSGYRRVSRLARAVTAPAARQPGRRGGGRARGHWAGSMTRFARDVRDGMDLYTDRHPRLAGRTLGGQKQPGVEYAKDGR